MVIEGSHKCETGIEKNYIDAREANRNCGNKSTETSLTLHIPNIQYI